MIAFVYPLSADDFISSNPSVIFCLIPAVNSDRYILLKRYFASPVVQVFEISVNISTALVGLKYFPSRINKSANSHVAL